MPQKQQSLKEKIFWVSLFSIAMGLLEAAVVIYIRKLYYPNGFDFPLVPIEKELALVEVTRELATMIMLLAIGILSGRNKAERFAWFLYSFAVWDILYYAFLKLFLGWPESLLTWDVLFLIPTTWIGPVLSPLIAAATMILFTYLILKFSENSKKVSISSKSWFFLISGAILMIVAFSWDYSAYALQVGGFKDIWTAPGNEALFLYSEDYNPEKFNWALFSIAELIILYGIFVFYRQNKHLKE